MSTSKVGATRHNGKAASKNNVISGTNSPFPPSLTVGVGTTDKKIEISKYQEPPTTIKEDFCQNASCGSPWTVHHHPVALKMHIKSFFNYGKYGSIVNTYGPDFCNEVIQEYKNRWTHLFESHPKGNKVNNPGGFFKTIVDELIAGGEPRNDPNDVTQRWEGVKPERLKFDDPDIYLKEYDLRRGNNAR
jgi:hypothetical protein